MECVEAEQYVTESKFMDHSRVTDVPRMTAVIRRGRNWKNNGGCTEAVGKQIDFICLLESILPQRHIPGWRGLRAAYFCQQGPE